jgi:aspartyl-tRNA(Asn)/glutamyl-tRNA(Gln) amidotransferase subunit A
VLSVISGRDGRDATCEDRDPLRLPTVPEDLKGFVIGVPKEYFPPELDPGVRRACERAIRIMRDLGAAVREVSLPHTSYAVPTYYIIAPAEASANLARYDGVRFGPRFDHAPDVRALYRSTRGAGFGAEVRRRIRSRRPRRLLRRLTRAQQVRAPSPRISALFDQRGPLFTPPPRAGVQGGGAVNPAMSNDIFTVTANLAGLPAMSVPIGRVNGLPVGGQLIGQAFVEDDMIEAAYALERAVPALEEAER